MDALESNPAQNRGAVFLKGLVGEAFDFSGTGAYLEIPDSPSLRCTNLTVEGWVRPRAYGSWYREIISKWHYGGYSYTMKLDLEGRATFGVMFVDGKTADVNTISPLTVGTWTHLAVTYDGAVLRLYRNGVEEATRNATNTINYGPTPILIGTAAGAFSFFDGLIDELTLYGVALDQSTIGRIHAAGTGGKCTPGSRVAIEVNGLAIKEDKAVSRGAALIRLLPESPTDVIFYTLDGTSPEVNGQLYTGPITLDRTALIRTVAYYDNFLSLAEGPPWNWRSCPRSPAIR